MTGEEFEASVAAMSPLERADFSAKVRSLADDLPQERSQDARRLRRIADAISPAIDATVIECILRS